MSGQAIVLSSRNRRKSVVPEVDYVLDGRARYADARDCVSTPFERCTPVRDFPTWRGKRNYSGRYWSITMGTHVPFESLYERTALLELDRDPCVAAISSQPMWVHWPKSQGGRSHAPDFFLRLSNGDGELVDVKPRKNINLKAAQMFAATAELCEQIGFRYRVICDLNPMRDRNLSALTRYGIAAWALPAASWPVVENVKDATTIQRIADELQQPEGPSALGWVYWMMWHGVLSADLGQPLSMSTEVTVQRLDVRK